MLVQIVNISRFSQLGPTTYKEESDDEDAWGEWSREKEDRSEVKDEAYEANHGEDRSEVKDEAYKANHWEERSEVRGEAYEANYEVKHEAYEVKDEAYEAYEVDQGPPWQYWFQEP